MFLLNLRRRSTCCIAHSVVGEAIFRVCMFCLPGLQASFALGVGELCQEVVETDSGFHAILRIG
jgi:hypothetical protein